MAIKKSQIEDKALRPDMEEPSALPEKREEKRERGKEFNYPEQKVTVKARNKQEADKKLKEIIN